ncbi:MAG TPA: SDR family oxidoreductase [Candidatus Nanopelagicaceae bacterium]|nr:SDR family oxidoreductase [Candidatus Nanopelagicaceae bacterium]
MKMINETAIVTGSTSGIGKKIAELFLKEGCKVAICSRNETNVNQTLAEFKKHFGDSVIGIPCDVSDPIAVKKLIDKTIEAFGSIRILVANAGVNLTYGPFQYLTLDKVNSDAKTIIGINLIGVLNSISAVLPQMIKQKYGRIITLSGGGADRPMENMTIYSASKGGVVAFSRCLAKELEMGENDIKINIFQPGMVLTNLYNVKLIETWKDKETFTSQMELLKKYVMTDVEKSSVTVIPYALPTCKENGKSFRGFPLAKMIRGFMKVSKEMKRSNNT